MEVELQFVWLGDHALVVPTMLADLDLRRSTARALLDTYFDTETLDLRRAGCSLRVRQADDSHRPRLTFKGPSRKRRDAKHRHETEIKIDSLPDEQHGLLDVLADHGVDVLIRKFSGVEFDSPPLAIGQLRNRRSHHHYAHGLHRLELTWDQLEFPTGPRQTRLEVEAASELAERLLDRAATELRELFGEDLAVPKRGKTRELCERLYPELLAA